MPAAYAHYTFGEKVLEHLDDDLKGLLSKHRDIFNIGLHGPDILFYYKPLSSNHVNQTAMSCMKKLRTAFLNERKKSFMNVLRGMLPAHTRSDLFVILCSTANATHMSEQKKTKDFLTAMLKRNLSGY